MVLIPLFRSFILIVPYCELQSLLYYVLIPLFRSFILILERLASFYHARSVLIPLFRSFILIFKKEYYNKTQKEEGLNPFVQVFYSNIWMELRCLHF